jgi:unspecific monooxygenase
VFSAEDLLDADRAPLVLRETLRLFPPVSMICRQTVRDVEVEGFLIPARAEVLISPYVMHRTAADYQPDPEVFRPERWMGLHAQPGAWLPYGAGPHWCVGQPLADAESEVVLPALAQRFTFRRNGSMGPMVADAIMHPADETLYVERR